MSGVGMASITSKESTTIATPSPDMSITTISSNSMTTTVAATTITSHERMATAAPSSKNKITNLALRFHKVDS